MSAFLPRTWWVSTDATVGSIRIGHWNVLADQLAESGGFEPQPPALAWPERSERLLAILDEAGPFDILSLTECDHFQDFWVPAMRARGLEGRRARKNEHRWDHGVALFYRTSMFIVKEVTICQDEVAVVSMGLWHNQQQQHLSVTTMHLKAKAAGATMRVQQINKLADERIIVSDEHTIILGDFNAPADEYCMTQLMANQQVRVVAGLPWTTWKRRKNENTVCRAIDHVLARNVHVVNYLNVPSDEAVLEAGLLPGRQYASDHLLLACDCVL